MLQKLKLTGLLVGPSFSGGILTVLISILLLAAANFSFFLRTGLLYDFLYGPGAPLDLIQKSHDATSTLNHTIFGNPILSKLMFFCFWMIVGLVIYVTLATIIQMLSETKGQFDQLNYIHAGKAQIEKDIILRFGFRAFGLLMFFMLGWLFISYLFPFCLLSLRVGVGNLWTPSSLLFSTLGLLVMVSIMHLFVIIIRIILLRPRIFGDWDSLG